MAGSNLCSQVPAWDRVSTLHSGSDEFATGVVSNPVTGEVYLAGIWKESLTGIPVGPHPPTDFSRTYGGTDGLVAKYDATGNLQWAFKVGGTGDDRVEAIHLDREGNIYITGSVSPGPIRFSGTDAVPGEPSYTNGSDQDFFLAKYDPEGRLLWSRHSEGTNDICGMGIASDPTGVYAVGWHKATVSFGSLPSHTSVGSGDMFLVKYSPEGNERWHVRGSSDNECYGEDVVCDGSRVYVTGEFLGNSLDILGTGRDSLYSTSNSIDGKAEIFAASFTADGGLIWANTVSGPEMDFSRGIAVEGGNLYLAGSLGARADFPGYTANPVPHTDKQDAFVCSMRADDGTTRWVRTLSGRSGDIQDAFDVWTDVTGQVYVTGYFNGSLYAEANTYNSGGQEDIFIASFSDSGEIRWVLTAGGSGHNYGRGVTSTLSGDVYVAGNYEGSATFGANPVPNDGGSNIFLAHLKLPCVDAIGGTLTASAGEVCPSDTVLLSLNGYLGFLRWESSPPGLESWSPLAAGLTATIAIFPAATADYRVFLESPSCAPDSSNVVRVNIHPLPTAILSGDTTRCSDGNLHPVRVDMTGTPPWEFSIRHNGTRDTLITGITASPYFHPSGEGLYEPVFIADFRCTGTVNGSAKVVVHEPPVAYAGADRELISQFDTKMEARLADNETGTWKVVSGSGVFEDPGSPVSGVSEMDTGENIFSWTVTHGVCPPAADQVIITVKDFLVPTVITPNGDGKNDRFRVEGIEHFRGSGLVVLNRWGSEVFRSFPYRNEWEGTDQSGKALQEGTYYFILTVTDTDTRKGTVMIIR